MNKERVFDDPLSALLGAPEPAAESKATSRPAAGFATSGPLKAIDVSKITVKQPKKPAGAAASSTATRAAEPAPEDPVVVKKELDNRLGLGISVLSAEQQAALQPVDVLTSPASLASDEDGIFSRAAPASGGDAVAESSTGTISNVRPQQLTTLRVAAEEDDEKIDDLVVGRILEREENAGAIFGGGSTAHAVPMKAATGSGQKHISAKASAEFEDLESEDFLEELAALTTQDSTRRAVASSSAAPSAAPAAATASKADLDDELFSMLSAKASNSTSKAAADLSMLDVDSYIKAHESTSSSLFS